MRSFLFSRFLIGLSFVALSLSLAKAEPIEIKVAQHIVK